MRTLGSTYQPNWSLSQPYSYLSRRRRRSELFSLANPSPLLEFPRPRQEGPTHRVDRRLVWLGWGVFRPATGLARSRDKALRPGPDRKRARSESGRRGAACRWASCGSGLWGIGNLGRLGSRGSNGSNSRRAALVLAEGAPRVSSRPKKLSSLRRFAQGGPSEPDLL